MLHWKWPRGRTCILARRQTHRGVLRFDLRDAVCDDNGGLACTPLPEGPEHEHARVEPSANAVSSSAVNHQSVTP
jgi:hypothetical protein